MAISNRGEMGVGGGSRGGSGSGVRNAFISNGVRKAANGKSRSSAGITGTGGASINPVYNESVPPTVIKINSGNTTPAKPPKAQTPSYSQLKDMPNLIKIDSAKGNSIKKVAYRRRTSN